VIWGFRARCSALVTGASCLGLLLRSGASLTWPSFPGNRARLRAQTRASNRLAAPGSWHLVGIRLACQISIPTGAHKIHSKFRNRIVKSGQLPNVTSSVRPRSLRSIWNSIGFVKTSRALPIYRCRLGESFSPFRSAGNPRYSLDLPAKAATSFCIVAASTCTNDPAATANGGWYRCRPSNWKAMPRH
jgi:hypothetical protein